MNTSIRFITLVVVFLLTYIPLSPVLADDAVSGETISPEVTDAVEAVTSPQITPLGTSEQEALEVDQQADEDTSLSAPDASKGSITLSSVSTADTNGNSKKVFNPGEPIRYYGTIKNTTGKVATASFVWSRSGPCGSANLWAGNLDIDVGTWLLNIDSTTPTGCPGTYKYTLSVTYNGKKLSKSINFSVAGSGCPTIKNWKGEYWSNPNLSGSPTLCRDDDSVNFDWGYGSPSVSVPSDSFSARWTRTLYFNSGLYRFHLRGDDGIRLWVDNTLLIDHWQYQGPIEYTADWNLNTGNHSLRVEYYENNGAAFIALWWELRDLPNENIAMGRPAYADSQESGMEAYRANDGNNNTRWSSIVSSNEEWWWTDIGNQTFERVVVNWEAAYAGRYFVGWSNDGINFTGNWYTLTNARIVVHDVGTRTARYVGILMQEHAPCCGNYSFWEFQVWRKAVVASGATADTQTEAVSITPDGDLVTIQMPQNNSENRLFLPLVNQ